MKKPAGDQLSPRLGRALCGVAAALALCAGTGLASGEPASVLIRVPAGHGTPAGYPELLAKWRQAGQVADVLYLTQGRPQGEDEPDLFESLTVLEFDSEGSYVAWQKDAAPALPPGLIVRRADALTHGELTPRDSNRSVFLANTYTPTVPPERYDEFVQGYIRPLMEAQRAARVLVRYTMYLERGDVGEAQSLSVLEYRDDVAFAATPDIKLRIRAELTATNPTYARFHDIKPQLRVDVAGTLLRYTELPPPDLSGLPDYVPEYEVVGGLRIVGSELKNAVDQLAEGFAKLHPSARISTSHIPSSSESSTRGSRRGSTRPDGEAVVRAVRKGAA